MAGRADKGIIITTGSFTAEARREASRDGVPPIELIDGEKLIGMLENLELGLRPVTTYEVTKTSSTNFRRSNSRGIPFADLYSLSRALQKVLSLPPLD